MQIAVWAIFLNFGSTNYYPNFGVDCLAVYFSQCSKEVLNYILFLLIFLIEVLDRPHNVELLKPEFYDTGTKMELFDP